MRLCDFTNFTYELMASGKKLSAGGPGSGRKPGGGYFDKKIGAIHNFNGDKVKLLRQVSHSEGQTWKVKSENDGKVYTIEPKLLHLLK